MLMLPHCVLPCIKVLFILCVYTIWYFTELPDLVPILSNFEDSLRHHPSHDFTKLKYLQCALEENCLASDAVGLPENVVRTLLRFDSLTMNYGLSDFAPVLDRSQWIWHSCHYHYHSFEVFAEYDLLSLNGTKVAEGHKASFCLEDSQCDVRGARRYRCGGTKQGISKNCGDLYGRYLDCQWIDITGVPEGIYSIQIKVNPTQLVPESDYSNNAIQCTVAMSKERLQVIHCSQSGELWFTKIQCICTLFTCTPTIYPYPNFIKIYL